ncbi:hypothetical protein F9K33_12505 [bacterium]|nr:MAG: hypothetical protein F9K33_12505 [bacterium]
MKSVSFLFGSGISISGGLPSTSAITEFLLSTKKVFHHTDNTFIFDEPRIFLTKKDEIVQRVQKLLDILRSSIDQNFEPPLTINYEDIYALADEIDRKRYRNPLVRKFLKEIDPQLRKLLSKDEDRILDNLYAEQLGIPLYLTEDYSFDELISWAKDYIHYGVEQLLWKEPKSLDYLHSILEACKDDQINIKAIFTLNHDLFLEQLLTNHIEIGFNEANDDIQLWNSNKFTDNHNRIPLLKLHGSINWHNFKVKGVYRLGIPTRTDWNHYKTYESQKSVILIGSSNKVSDYYQDTFFELHNLFKKYLFQSDYLIISGYGFGDIGINLRISEWLINGRHRKVILIHPDPKSVLRSTEQDNIILLKQKIDDIQWSEILSMMR